MTNKPKPDRLAAELWAAERRAAAALADADARLRDAQSAQRAHAADAPPQADPAADAAAVARAEAFDLVHGGDTAAATRAAIEAAARQAADVGTAYAERGRELAAAVDNAQRSRDALAAVFAEAKAARQAALRDAAGRALAQARATYRARLTEAIDAVSDIAALGALAQIGLSPHRSNTPRCDALLFPAADAFAEADRPALAAVGAQWSGPQIAVTQEAATAAAVRDYEALAALLLGADGEVSHAEL